MANLLSMIGYIGTGLVIGAYAPQISHLWTERCSAGICSLRRDIPRGPMEKLAPPDPAICRRRHRGTSLRPASSPF